MTQQPRGSGPDPVGDFQRWLMRSGVRGVTREVGDQVRTLLRGERGGDVWHSATAPPPPEAPECAWCPICRAARMLRGSRPGLASQMAAAGDTLAAVVAEAVSTVEAALAAAQRTAAENAERAAGGGGAGPGDGHHGAAAATEERAGEGAGRAGPADAWGAVVQDAAGRTQGSPHEPDDRG